MNGSAELLRQYAALASGTGVADLTGRTLLEIRGADRTQFLHAFCTSDIKTLTPGQGCEAFITSPQGKTLGHVLIFCEADRFWLDTSPGQAAGLIAHFDKYVISEDVQFIDRTDETGILLVAGKVAPQTIGNSSNPQRVAPVPYVVNAFFAWLVRRDVAAGIDSLVRAGALLCADAAVEARRIESGFPLFGRDITDDNLPQEVGRDAQAISFTKGCYLGQETVARIDALGHVNRKLVGMKFHAAEPPPVGCRLLFGDKEVGRVTSAAWSPALDAPLALGYVRTLHARPGTALSSACGAVEVVSLPVADR
jgi:folate-binding protein YgfZ